MECCSRLPVSRSRLPPPKNGADRTCPVARRHASRFPSARIPPTPLAERRSGDGTTPSGVFGIGTMTAPNGDQFQFFGNGANPGVHGDWHQVQYGDCWEETPGDPAYNTLVARPPSQCVGPDDEYLPGSPTAYSRAALIDANMGPNRSGDQPGEPALAAAIFLHRYSLDANGNSKATAGCVSLAGGDLDFVLTRIVPGQAYFVIG